MASFDLIPDVEKGQLKLIYKALSEDLKIAAKKFGGSKAVGELNKANKFYQMIKKNEDYLQPIVNIADPDRIVSNLLNASKEGVTKLKAIKKIFKYRMGLLVLQVIKF